MGESIRSFAMPVTAVGLACCPVPTGLSCAGTAGGEGRAHTTYSPGAHSPAVHVLPWLGWMRVWWAVQYFPRCSSKSMGSMGCE